MYDNSFIELEIVGIIRENEIVNDKSYFYYDNKLIDYVINKNKDSNIVIVSHGSVISYMKRILNIKSSHIQKGKIEIFNNVNFEPLFDQIKKL